MNLQNPATITQRYRYCSQMSLLLLLAGCTTIQPTWDELWSAPTTRTDLVETQLVLDIVPYEEMRSRCEHLSPVARGCYTKGRIVMQDYGSWPQGSHLMNLRVQYLSWKAIGAKCGIFSAPVCSNNGTIYTYDYSIADVEKMGYVGQELSNMLGFKQNQVGAENILGHEFWHALGHDDIQIFEWDVN